MSVEVSDTTMFSSYSKAGLKKNNTYINDIPKYYFGLAFSSPLGAEGVKSHPYPIQSPQLPYPAAPLEIHYFPYPPLLQAGNYLLK